MTAGITPAIDEARDLLKQARRELADQLPGNATLLAQRALVHATIAAASLAVKQRIDLTQRVVDGIAAAVERPDDTTEQPELEPARGVTLLADAILIAQRGALSTDSPDVIAKTVARLILHRDTRWPGAPIVARRALNCAHGRHDADQVRTAAGFLGIEL